MRVVAIIPALNPDYKLIDLIDELRKSFKKIIIVNDGSSSDEVFKKIKNKECTILAHEVNRGKGEALKTAFNYYLDNFAKDYCGVVCLDADGQHKVSDAIKISDRMEKEDKFVLGTRLFNTKSTPLRNKLGNRITSRVFKWFYHVYLKDTQTGLRAIPNRLLKKIVKIDGSRFEYELNVLISLVKAKEEIVEEDIKTVYLKNSNKKSHFKVLRDSWQIYQVILKNKKY